MIRLVPSALAVSLFASVAAFGASESLTLKSVKVLRPISLRRIDGKVVTLKPEVHAPADLRGLPAPEGADESLCGELGDGDADTISRRTKAFTDLIHLVTERIGNDHALAPDEIAFLKTIPRCEPFLNMLGLLANSLSPAPAGPKQYALDQLHYEAKTFEAPRLELWLDDWLEDGNSKVVFAVPGLHRWGAGSFDAGETGRAIGLTIEDQGESPEPLEGSAVEGRETCTTTDTVRECDRNGCHEETKLVPGHKRYTYAPVYWDHNWKLTFTAPGGERLMEVQATTLRTEDRGDSGTCYPDRPHGHGGGWHR
jgi:hypothetical protein